MPRAGVRAAAPLAIGRPSSQGTFSAPCWPLFRSNVSRVLPHPRQTEGVSLCNYSTAGAISDYIFQCAAASHGKLQYTEVGMYMACIISCLCASPGEGLRVNILLKEPRSAQDPPTITRLDANACTFNLRPESSPVLSGSRCQPQCTDPSFAMQHGARNPQSDNHPALTSTNNPC